MSQYALKPSQVSPIAGALQQAPQYMQNLQSAQQAMAQTHIKQVQSAFAQPQAQALLTKAQADAGVAQASQNVAMSTIGAHIANAKAITAGNQYLAAKQHADAITAGVGATVATTTQPAQVKAVLAKTAEQQAKARKEAVIAKMEPNTIRAQRLGLVQPTIVASMAHPYAAQVHPAPAVRGGEAGAAAAGNQYAGNSGQSNVPAGYPTLQNQAGSAKMPAAFNLSPKYMSVLNKLNLSADQANFLRAGIPIKLPDGRWVKYDAKQRKIAFGR